MFRLILVFCIATSAVNGAIRMAHLSEKTRHGEMLYQVSIQENYNHVCGGSLISEFHVLTAAHCVSRIIWHPEILNYVSVTVEVGTSKLHHGVRLGVKRISMKQGFIPNEIGPFIMPNDIAVITLRDSAVLYSNVRILSLPHPLFRLSAGSKALVGGFGGLVFGGEASFDMRKSDLYIMKHDDCANYLYYNKGRLLQSSQICASGEPGQGPCTGDSGGAMVYAGHVVVGIVSGGEYVCGSRNPDIYTKVSDHLEYIRYEMNFQYLYDPATPSPAVAIDLVDPRQFSTQQEYDLGFPNQYSLVPFSRAFQTPHRQANLTSQTGILPNPVVPETLFIPSIPFLPATPLILGDLFIIKPSNRRF